MKEFCCYDYILFYSFVDHSDFKTMSPVLCDTQLQLALESLSSMLAKPTERGQTSLVFSAIRHHKIQVKQCAPDTFNEPTPQAITTYSLCCGLSSNNDPHKYSIIWCQILQQNFLVQPQLGLFTARSWYRHTPSGKHELWKHIRFCSWPFVPVEC